MEDNRCLSELYYDAESPAGFGSVKKLAQFAGVNQKTAQTWLSKQFAYTLHKPSKRRYATGPYRVAKIDDQWQVDLVEMTEFAAVNDNFKYLLTCIDLFSRFAWARGLKNEESNSVLMAFRDIIDDSGRKPKKLQSDAGKEFQNRHFQHYLNVNGITFFVVQSAFKAAVVERFNRTLKGKMYKYFTYTGSHRWIEVLPRLLTSYNNSVHRSIGVAPSNVNNVNEQEIWQRQQQRLPQKVAQRDKHTMFRVGDHVRLSHTRKVFDRGYLPTWTDAVYKISKIIKTPKIDDDEFSGPV